MLELRGPRRGDEPWHEGVDDPQHTGDAVLYRIALRSGGLATSGDARRYVVHRGRRLGHILDPSTGWPVADTCVEAGTLATLAYLRGAGAREFLEAQNVTFQLV